MSKTYRWPNGEFMPQPYFRNQPATGIMVVLYKIAYLFKLYKKVNVSRQMQGDKVIRTLPHLDLVKLPEWQKGNQNRRFRN
ncbi:MAG: hypothetical protein H7289_07685 [Mucilaginibacter sp.]|nr:hypothetical protein [Mucilaginibacter sp.]